MENKILFGYNENPELVEGIYHPHEKGCFKEDMEFDLWIAYFTDIVCSIYGISVVQLNNF